MGSTPLFIFVACVFIIGMCVGALLMWWYLHPGGYDYDQQWWED